MSAPEGCFAHAGENFGSNQAKGLPVCSQNFPAARGVLAIAADEMGSRGEASRGYSGSLQER
jgi:hypothetical protein